MFFWFPSHKTRWGSYRRILLQIEIDTEASGKGNENNLNAQKEALSQMFCLSCKSGSTLAGKTLIASLGAYYFLFEFSFFR